MLSTAKVTECWPAQAVGATIIEPIKAKALKLVFMFMADLLSVSGAKQQRGDVVEGEGGDHEHGRHPESDLNDAAGDRARAGRAVGAGSPGLPVDEVEAVTEDTDCPRYEEWLVGC